MISNTEWVFDPDAVVKVKVDDLVSTLRWNLIPAKRFLQMIDTEDFSEACDADGCPIPPEITIFARKSVKLLDEAQNIIEKICANAEPA